MVSVCVFRFIFALPIAFRVSLTSAISPRHSAERVICNLSHMKALGAYLDKCL